MTVLFRRADGTFVILLNGFPYHVLQSDPLFPLAQAAGGNAPLEEPPALPTPEQIRAGLAVTDIQFALAAVGAGIITANEAEAWVARGELPAIAVAAIGTLPEAIRPAARIRFSGARTIARLDPFITGALASVAGMTETQLDAFFQGASQL